MAIMQRTKISTSIVSSIANRRPALLEIRSSTWFITAAVCVAIFTVGHSSAAFCLGTWSLIRAVTDIFLYAVIVPVFPYSLRDRVGIADSDVQHWLSVLLAVYAAGLLAGAPICGIFADRVKYRQWPLLLGLLAVGGSTAMLCTATSIAVLVVGRVLQGLAASVIWVVGLALLTDTVNPEEIATHLGYVGTALSLATLVAPLLGGIVYKQAGYYAVFGMCFGLIALDIVLRLSLIEKKAARKWLEGPAHQSETSSSPSTETLDVNDMRTDKCEKRRSPVIAVEKSVAKHRIPPILRLCASPRMLAATWGTIVVSSFMCGLDTTLTIFVARTFGFNSLQAGLVFLAPLAPYLLGPVFGLVVDKYGARWLSTGGFVFMIPPWVLLRLVTHNSLGQKVLLCALLALIGLGAAVAITGLMAEFSKVVDEKATQNPDAFGQNGAYAQAYGIFNVAWATGSLVGAFWSGGVYNRAGWGTLGWSFALLSASGAIPVLLFTDGWIGLRRHTHTSDHAQQEETLAS